MNCRRCHENTERRQVAERRQTEMEGMSADLTARLLDLRREYLALKVENRELRLRLGLSTTGPITPPCHH